MLQYGHYGASNDGDIMVLMNIGHTSKRDMQLSIHNLFHFRRHWQLCHHVSGGNYAMTPTP